MTRPPVKENKTQYTVMLKPSMVKELDHYAEKFGLTRSQFMANLLENALEDTKILDKAGIFRAALISRQLLEKFKEKVFSGKVTINEKGELEIKK